MKHIQQQDQEYLWSRAIEEEQMTSELYAEIFDDIPEYYPTEEDIEAMYRHYSTWDIEEGETWSR